MNRKLHVNLIRFILVVSTTQIGCGVLFNFDSVNKFDTIILTRDDLPKMQVTVSRRISRPQNYPYMMYDKEMRRDQRIKDSFAIKGFEQVWSAGWLTVQYWLFDSSSSAQNVGMFGFIWPHAAAPNYHPEPNSEEVIGDATMGYIPKKPEIHNITQLWFTKNNVLVYISIDGYPSDHLAFARSVARKIEGKIETVIQKK